ncbi:unnamed protein product, partial [Allacma fusca]
YNVAVNLIPPEELSTVHPSVELFIETKKERGSEDSFSWNCDEDVDSFSPKDVSDIGEVWSGGNLDLDIVAPTDDLATMNVIRNSIAAVEVNVERKINAESIAPGESIATGEIKSKRLKDLKTSGDTESMEGSNSKPLDSDMGGSAPATIRVFRDKTVIRKRNECIKNSKQPRGYALNYFQYFMRFVTPSRNLIVSNTIANSMKMV